MRRPRCNHSPRLQGSGGEYEEVYLHAYRDGREAQQRLRAYFETYNSRRLHQSLDYRTPDEVYFRIDPVRLARAA
jgi:putative transposase